MRTRPQQNINIIFLFTYNYKSCTKSKQVRKEEKNFKGYKTQETKGLLYS
jgi:hypothetical protein